MGNTFGIFRCYNCVIYIYIKKIFPSKKIQKLNFIFPRKYVIFYFVYRNNIKNLYIIILQNFVIVLIILLTYIKNYMIDALFIYIYI